MKTTLDAIIGENQSAAIKSRTILHTSSTIQDAIDVSHNLDSSIAETSLNFREPFTVCLDFMPFVKLFCYNFVIRKLILPFSSLVTETNPFTRLKLRTPISNLKLKKKVSYLNLLPLYEDFARDVNFHAVLYYCG